MESMDTKVEGNGMDYWRRCIQKTKRDRIRNENIRKEIETTEKFMNKKGTSRPKMAPNGFNCLLFLVASMDT